jgi:hypothetical protein
VLVEAEGSTDMADSDGDSDEARTFRPLQAAACTYRIAFGPRTVVPQQSEAPAHAVAPAACEANCAHHRAVRRAVIST